MVNLFNSNRNMDFGLAPERPASRVVLVFLAPFFFGVSYLLLYFYTGGDQVHYHRFYESLKSAHFNDVMGLALSHVSSREPVTAYTLWLGAQLGIEKNIYVSFLNLILLVSLCALFIKHKVPVFVMVLLFCNFYLIVLMTGAERLKIAYILLVFFALLQNWRSVVSLLLSPLAHLSALVFIPSLFLASVSRDVRTLFKRASFRKAILINGVLGLLVFGVLIYPLWDAVSAKGWGYASLEFDQYYLAGELVNLTGLLVVAIWASKDRLRMLMAIAPMFFFVALLGGMRVNMIAVTIVVYLLMTEERLAHPASLALLLYLFVKSVPFVLNIFIYGNGFA